jgi:pimeloyl-ACP methyl ester carboxylesterase
MADRRNNDVRQSARPRLGRFLAALTVTVSAWGGPGRAEALVPAECRPVSIPTHLDLLVPVTVHGTLCDPAGGPAATVQLLLHGATYDSSYWDFPYHPDQYSYVVAANRAGYSTLNIDRVGYGRSSQVLSVLLTGVAQAAVVHQIVGQLRAGTIGGTRYVRVITVGHSVGAGIAIIEAATYHDVEGVILTGAGHPQSLTSTVDAFTRYTHPAFLDPQFAGSGVDPGYLTTVPGVRNAFFYSDTDVDPAVVAIDEATKDKISVTELGDVVALGFTSPLSRLITAPTLLLDGSRDALFCAGLLASDCSSAAALKTDEAPFFSSQAELQTYVQAGAGHDVALSLNAADGYQAMLTWADAYVGR